MRGPNPPLSLPLALTTMKIIRRRILPHSSLLWLGEGGLSDP